MDSLCWCLFSSLFLLVWTYNGFCFWLANKDVSPLPLPPPRRESFNLLPVGTNPPHYNSVVDLANDFSPGMLTLTKNDKALLKESYTLSSTSSYSYSETSANSLQQVNQSTAANDISNFSASATDSTQRRKVSSLKLTPVTIPDPPSHLNHQTEASSSPPPSSPPQAFLNRSHPPSQRTSVSVHLGAENQKNPEYLASNLRVEVTVPDQDPNQTSTQAPSQEMTKPPTVPPRPSPAQVLVHTWLSSAIRERRILFAYWSLQCLDLVAPRVTKRLHTCCISWICKNILCETLTVLVLEEGVSQFGSLVPNIHQIITKYIFVRLFKKHYF